MKRERNWSGGQPPRRVWRSIATGLVPVMLAGLATPVLSFPAPRSGWPLRIWSGHYWPSQSWPSQSWPSQSWPSQSWSSQDWSSQDWSSQNGTGQSGSNQNWLAANRRAEDTCINAAADQGWRVTDILERNSYEGGSEVIMRVQQRRGSITVGCDYATNTGRVQLYRLEGTEDRDDRNEFDGRYDNRYGNERVSNRNQAEAIARRTLEQQLGVDANSEVIRISETRRSDDQWYVQGDVNGAPFAVRIDRDGSVEDFQLR